MGEKERESPAGEEASVFLSEDVCRDEVLTQGNLPVNANEFAIPPPATRGPSQKGRIRQVAIRDARPVPWKSKLPRPAPVEIDKTREA